MGKLIFNCGCEFNLLNTEETIYADHHDGQLPTGIDVDVYNIPHNCPRTWGLIANGHTKGVFQLEGHLGKTWAKKLNPSKMEELAALISLIRPGCLRAMSGDPPKSMTQRYVDRKNNLEPVEYFHEELRPILEETQGVLVFQEQSMRMSTALAGFNMQRADVLRKCIAKGSLVYTQSGPRPIEEICNNKNLKCKILTVDNDNNLVYKPIKKVWSNGKQKTHTLKCNNGYRIDLTKNHQVYTQNGWVDLKDMKPGDFVAIPKSYTYKGCNKTSIEESIIISYIISEGYHCKNETKITNSDEWVLSVFRECCKKRKIQTSEYKHKNGCVDIRIIGEDKKCFDRIIPHAKSRQKKIPKQIYSAMNGATSAFIGHYFSAEGSVNNVNIDISSTSKDIIFTLQAMLLRDGIHSSFSVKNSTYKNEPYVSYRLCVCGNYYIKKFLETYKKHICPRKIERIEKILKNDVSHSNSRFLVPSCFIKAATRNKNINCVLADPSGSFYNKNQTYDRAETLNQVVESELLSDILGAEFLFSKVTSIEESEEVETFDYEVDDENLHFGFVNGILVHNSIGKKQADVMQSLESEFVEGCIKKGLVAEEQAKEIFNWIRESQRYSFNASHGYGYGEGSYWTAYLKAHFPHQFYCSYLDGAKMKQDPYEEIHEIVNDAKIQGIDICVPRLKDKQGKPYIKDNVIYFGLGDIRQIGASSLKKILEGIDVSEAQVGIEVSSWQWLDFLLIFSGYVSSTACEAIISSGGIDYMHEPRTKMLYEMSMFSKLSPKEKDWITEEYLANNANQLVELLEKCAKPKKEGGGCANYKRVEIVKGIISLLKTPPHVLDDTPDMISWMENKFLGTSLTCSKVDSCEGAFSANSTCIDIINGKKGYCVVAVEITRVQEIKTKRGKNPGKKMAFIGGSDSTCSLDNFVVFPESWTEFGDLLHEGNTVLIRCESKNDSLIVEKVSQI